MLKDHPDAPDRLRVSPRVVFVSGSVATLLLVGLIVLYVPAPPPPESMQQVKSYTAYDQATASSSSGAPVQGAPAAVVSEGDRSPAGLFTTYCSQCHGVRGDGDAPLARMMTIKPTDLVKGPFRLARTPEGMVAIIRNGVGSMPGFAEEISEEEALSLSRYVLELESQQGEPSDAPPSDAPSNEATSKPTGEYP
jgi:mono/diheme cytochrome c family protein